jgi:hypothetical protein
MIIGYARVSTEDQTLDSQLDALKAAGAGRIFSDRITGSARHRPELDRMLDQVREGDVVMVTKYDRLSRSLKDLLEIVDAIGSRGAGFRSLAEDIDTTTPAGRLDLGADAGGARGGPEARPRRRQAPCPHSRPEGRGPPHARRRAPPPPRDRPALPCQREDDPTGGIQVTGRTLVNSMS